MVHGRGFRLIDFIASLFILIVLGSFFLPTINRTRDYAWVTKCTTNLRTIGQAMSMYAAQNHHQFPRTRWDPNSTTVQFYTHPDAQDPFAVDGPAPNDVTASLYLLARTQEVPPETFFCPLTSLVPQAESNPSYWMTRSNFSGPTELTYSMANPFPSPQAVSSGFHWDDRLSSEYPVLADMNPGANALNVSWNSSEDAIKKANTRNHLGGQHQAILFGDMHADARRNPFAGVANDNIYTYGPCSASSGGTGVIGFPTSADDAVLLPVSTIDPGALTDPWTIDRQREVFWNIARFAVLAGLGTIIYIRIARRKLAHRIGYFAPALRAILQRRK